MKKIILINLLVVLSIIGCSQEKEGKPNTGVPSKTTYSLIPMGDSTTLQVQYENSTTVLQLKLPSKPDLNMEKIDSITYVEETTSGYNHINIKFSSEYTTQFAEITKRNIGNFGAVIMDNKVLTMPVIGDSISSPYIYIHWNGTKEEASQLIESLKGKPLEFYCIKKP